jgi:hypothetical protein
VAPERAPVGRADVPNSYSCARIEGFFGNLKTGMRGAYKKVSPRYLQSYLNGYTWRYNARHEEGSMFDQLLDRAAGVA